MNSDKPPAGSYKLVTVAPAAAVPGACSPEIIDQIASDAVVRTELLRASAVRERVYVHVERARRSRPE